ncbi:hypothetical protein MSG28_012512 [Choristoneura fumiferana]|uniref:Uncharacterized protein n=1 Tax=Choristoneura fumiferana TaxID=7141 RepID=A0ACC0KEH5_CHOFU|nr:hypothetical protein MSG28_012512 [Choristoneura fumiferana]
MVVLFDLDGGHSKVNTRQKRYLLFTKDTQWGIFLAIAVPIDIPDKNVFVSYNFEANYSPVTNITEIDDVLFPNLPAWHEGQGMYAP